MRTRIDRIFKTLFFGFGIIFILMGAGTGLLQTEWGKQTFIETLHTLIAKKDIRISYQQLSGILPFNWQMRGVEIQIGDSDKIAIDKIEFRLYLIRLLRKQIALRTLYADNVVYTGPEGRTFFQKKEVAFELPYKIYIKSFHLQNLKGILPDLPEGASLNVKGKARLDTTAKFFYFDINAHRNDFKDSFLRFKARGEKQGLVRVDGDTTIDSLKAFAPWVHFPFDVSGTAAFHLTGSWLAFERIIFDSENPERLPILGKIRGALFDPKGLFPEDVKRLMSNAYTLSANFDVFSDRSISMPTIYLQNDFLLFNGNAEWSKNFQFAKSEGILKTEALSRFSSLFPYAIDGRVYAEVYAAKAAEGYESHFHFIIDPLTLGKYQLIDCNGDITAHFNQITDGKGDFQTELFGEIWHANFDWSFLPEKGFHIEGLHFASSFAELSGSFDLIPERIIGNASFRIDDLYHLQTFHPDYPFYGGLEGVASFNVLGMDQEVDLKLDLFNFYFKELHSNEIKLDLNLKNPFTHPKGEVAALFSGLRFHNLVCDGLTIKTSNLEENWPFEIYANGNWKAPLEMIANGFWRYDKGLYLFNLQSFHGHALNHPFDMPKPIDLSVGKNHLQLSDMEINFSSSKLLGKAVISDQNTDVRLILDHFPMDFLSLNPLDIDVVGFMSLEALFTQNKRSTEGFLNLDIENIEVVPLGEENAEKAAGFAKATLNGNKLAFEGQLLIGGEHIIEGKGEVPFVMELSKLHFALPRHLPMRAEFIYDAKAEEILDFVSTGPHRLEGDVKCHLLFNQTFEHPQIQGACELKNGVYENYYTGTHLKDIYAKFIAKKDHLILESVTGNDGQKGTFLGKGDFAIDPDKHYPYNMHLTFTNLLTVKIDLVTATGDGEINVKGDSRSGLATGNLQVVRADFSIPEKIPQSIPVLDATYINEPKIKRKERKKIARKTAYPMHLQMTILAPSNIFINGRGLASEWLGTFKIGGTYDDIIAKGKLELKNGEFVFSGRAFELVNGSLNFTGQSNVPPYLDLSGKNDQKGALIFANLKGPLNAPRLTFKSIPSLPISAILSLLIFGQDISEISVFQAGQLAAAAATLAGEGPDILELARKTLGVDRLAVITKVTGEGEESTALQVGKYLTRGILFTVSQGADPSSGNIAVEVDMTHGFIFEAEALQQLEQGRFSLKWNMNY